MEVISKIDNNRCLICGGKAKGVNFKVASCKPCAEFYRRSILANRKYKCIRGSGKCNLEEKNYGKRLCRYCRLQKCKIAGMCFERHVENFENPTKIEICKESSFNDKDTITDSNSSFTSLPHSEIKQLIDMSPIEKAIEKIFTQTHAIPINPRIKLSCLQQLDYGLSLCLEELRPKCAVSIVQEVDIHAMVNHHEKFMVALSKMLIYCEKFVELEYVDKMSLFKNSWRLIYQLERHYSSIQYFGGLLEDQRVLFDDTSALEYGNVHVRIKGVDEATRQKIFVSSGNFRHQLFQLLINPMKSLQLTQYEMAFLIAQILFSTQGNDSLSAKAQHIIEEVLEQISNEMHHYYTNGMRLSNYAQRLIKLTKLVDANKVHIQRYIDIDSSYVAWMRGRSSINGLKDRTEKSKVVLPLPHPLPVV